MNLKILRGTFGFLDSLTELMNEVLSPSYFVQFGTSAMVLCASAYLLSVVCGSTTTTTPHAILADAPTFFLPPERSSGECTEIR